MLKTDLQLYFKLDETSGNVTDSVSAITGTVSGATLNQAGKINTAVDFDGVDDYIEVADADIPASTFTSGFTLSAWIKPDSIGETAGRIMDKSTGDNGHNGFRLTVGTDSGFGGAIRLSVNNASTKNSGGFITYGDGIWHHILVTVSSDAKVNFYINGALSGDADQLTGALSGITTTNALRIGNRSGATDRTFDGLIDEVGIWSRVLTIEEISTLYSRGQGVSYPFPYINITKPGGTSYTNQNTIGKQQYDQIDITYDDVNVFYDGVNESQYTSVLSPFSPNNALQHLQLYFNLDETTGNVTDSVSGVVGTNTGVTFAAGKINNGAVFDGTSTNQISIPSIFGADVTTASVSCWVSFSTFATNSNVFWKLFGDSLYPRLFYQQSSDLLWLQFRLDGSTRNIQIANFSTNHSINTPYHIVATFDSSVGTKLYINNVLVGQDDNIGTDYNGGASALLLGRDTNLSYYMNGWIDEVGIFDIVLTTNEISALYNNGRGRTYPFDLYTKIAKPV